MKKRMSLYLVAVGIFSSCTNSANSQQGHQLIIADPDVRITYDGNVAHMEAYITASPAIPGFLIAGGEIVVPGRALQASEARIYYSMNAGASWTPVLLPEEIVGGWDNAVAAGINGDMYFLTSNWQNGLTIYRTSDSGKNWKFTIISNSQGWDRPYIAVDNTKSLYRNRLYVVGETEEGVTVISSADGGQTFTKPVVACHSRKNQNMATTSSPMLLDDGSLLIACAPYPDFPARAGWKEADIGLVVSKDGGQTFSPYRRVFTIHRPLPQDYYQARVQGDILLSGNFMPGPSFTIAPPGSKFGDRIYAAWQDVDSLGQSQLLFSWSADHGLTWDLPKPADAQPANSNGSASRKAVPMIAVNHEGIVGIAWYDGRNVPDNKGYDIYFTASADGGRTFLPSTRLSSATSLPVKYRQNTFPLFQVNKPSQNGERTINMTSPFSTRSTGADYATMTVDALGRFHPLWIDARDENAWQLYTSTIRIIPEKTLQMLAKKRSIAGKNDLQNCVLDDRIRLLLGEPKWNKEANEITVPVRLLNLSADTIIEPVNVRIWGMMLSNSRAKQYARVSAPAFFNPATATFGDSTELIYPVSLQAPLFPSGVTPDIHLRMQITMPEWMDFKWQAVVTGGGCLLKK